MALPDAWVQRIFDRFTAIYGSQKVGAMWAGANLEEVRQVWGEALGQFSADTFGQALRSLEQTSTEWPPTLPTFVTLCRQYNRPEHRVFLPAPAANASDDATARANLAKIREMLASALKGKVIA